MKILEFSNNITLKTSPFIDDMPILINKAKEAINNGNVDIENISINKLLVTQPLNVPPEHESVEIFSEYDDLPLAVLVDGYYHILDGHHRILSDIDDGFTEITMYVAIPDEMIEEKKKNKQSNHTPVLPFRGWWYGMDDEHEDSDQGSFDSAGDGGGE